eukprot:TRINITY_DN12178_c0_g1_i2.p1 TRINITY_DN12178_c0_g1~~TRINITY_DN12178_c0_g1_i2.p1  ORF type:complete len:126 (+),score=16.88 TRINITY_DN12178_c0_g1_i2:268-645(+)
MSADEAERRAFVQRKARAALQERGRYGCCRGWAKQKSSVAQYGFNSWQLVSHVCISRCGSKLLYKPDRGVLLEDVTDVQVIAEPVQTCGDLANRQYQLIVHLNNRNPLVLNCVDKRCFDVHMPRS